MSIQIVTGSNAAYLPRMAPYLASLHTHSRAENYLLGVGCTPKLNGLSRVIAIPVPVETAEAGAEETQSLQHGGFLPYLPGEADDTIIFTDGDMIMQRAITLDEWNWLENFPENTVACQWNLGEWQTLEHEAGRLEPKVSIDELRARFDGALDATCWNVGVLAARRSMWERLNAEYLTCWRETKALFGHRAWQQWLIGALFHRLGLTIERMPFTFHLHGHVWEHPPGIQVVPGVGVFFEGECVLFRHALRIVEE